MKCVYCHGKAGFLKRTCSDCIRLVDAFNQLPASFGYRELLDQLMETGVSNEKIDAFLNTDLDGSGSVQEHITARMTNEVMAGLGQPSHMKGTDVKKVKQLIAEGKSPSLTDEEVVDYHQLPRKD